MFIKHLLLLGIFYTVATAQSAIRHVAPDILFGESGAVCLGTAMQNRVFEKGPNGALFTATGFSVSEVFKGTFAGTVEVEQRGGRMNGRGETYCGQPDFKVGRNYLLYLGRRPDGTLFCNQAVAGISADFFQTLEAIRTLDSNGLDVSDRTADTVLPMAAMSSGLLPADTGVSSRFIQGDRGEPIEYVVDMDAWPAGITSNQALSAVSNAFAAWSAVSSLHFKFAGIESFGMAAADLNRHDGRIYVQLHDTYNFINSPDVLGRGGRTWSYSPEWPDGGLGGRVGTNEFDITTQGELVIEHTAPTLSILSHFEEVVCHELGHVLSLGHSSEDEFESNALLRDATMYFTAHFDGRAAALREWDTNTFVTAYPAVDTPPYGFDRVIRAVTSPSPQAPFASGLNQVEFPDNDLQGGSVPLILSSTSSYGTFALQNSRTLFYTPNGWYPDSPEAPSGSYYDFCTLRLSDGTNLSPPIRVRITQLLSDGGRDRLPDSWQTPYGVVGYANDPDHDELNNRDEWFLNTRPNDADSVLKLAIHSAGLSWNSRPDELYQLQSTTNLAVGFSDEGSPVTAGTTNETVGLEFAGQKFYRVQRVR